MKSMKAFTLIETIIVMIILMLIIGMIFFIIVFIFQTMYRINFNIETIAVFETTQSRLDSVFSMWYKDDSDSIEPLITNSSRSIEFPTIKIEENDSSWLNSVGTSAKVTFDKQTHTIKIEVDGESEKSIISDNYVEDVQFGFETGNNRTITATITFISPNGRFTERKFTKFRTIN